MEYYVSGSWANYSLFYPIPELNVSDGDGTLFFISSNALTFVEPCDDPVFSAHVPVTLPALDNDDTDNGTEVTYFLEDRLTGVLGCLEQVGYLFIENIYGIVVHANLCLVDSTNGAIHLVSPALPSVLYQKPQKTKSHKRYP